MAGYAHFSREGNVPGAVIMMKQVEQRSIALRAVRSQLRRMGIAIDAFLPFADVLKVLDDLSRSEPDLVASQWYSKATDQQIRLLRKEWREAVKPVYEKNLWEHVL
jgi:hypothetical protein